MVRINLIDRVLLYEREERMAATRGKDLPIDARYVRAGRADGRSRIARACSIPGCGEKHLSKGLCRKHYRKSKANVLASAPEPVSVETDAPDPENEAG
jgi:hypothetical protein